MNINSNSNLFEANLLFLNEHKLSKKLFLIQSKNGNIERKSGIGLLMSHLSHTLYQILDFTFGTGLIHKIERQTLQNLVKQTLSNTNLKDSHSIDRVLAKIEPKNAEIISQLVNSVLIIPENLKISYASVIKERNAIPLVIIDKLSQDNYNLLDSQNKEEELSTLLKCFEFVSHIDEFLDKLHAMELSDQDRNRILLAIDIKKLNDIKGLVRSYRQNLPLEDKLKEKLTSTQLNTLAHIFSFSNEKTEMGALRFKKINTRLNDIANKEHFFLASQDLLPFSTQLDQFESYLDFYKNSHQDLAFIKKYNLKEGTLLDDEKIETIFAKAEDSAVLNFDDVEFKNLSVNQQERVFTLHQKYVMTFPNKFPAAYVNLQTIYKQYDLTPNDLTKAKIVLNQPAKAEALQLALKLAAWPQIKSCLAEIDRDPKKTAIPTSFFNLENLNEVVTACQKFPAAFVSVKQEQFEEISPKLFEQLAPTRDQNSISLPSLAQLKLTCETTLKVFEETLLIEKTSPTGFIVLDTEAQNALLARVIQHVLYGDKANNLVYPKNSTCFTCQEFEKLSERLAIKNDQNPWFFYLKNSSDYIKSDKTPQSFQLILIHGLRQTFRDFGGMFSLQIDGKDYLMNDPEKCRPFLETFFEQYLNYMKNNPEKLQQTVEFNQLFCRDFGLNYPLSKENYERLMTTALEQVISSINNEKAALFLETFVTNNPLDDQFLNDLDLGLESQELQSLLRLHLIKTMLLTSQGVMGAITPKDIDPEITDHSTSNLFKNIMQDMNFVTQNSSARILDIHPDSYSIGVKEEWKLMNQPVLDYEEKYKNLEESKDAAVQAKIKMANHQFSVFQADRLFEVPSISAISYNNADQHHSELVNFKDILISPYLWPYFDTILEVFKAEETPYTLH